MRTSSDKEFPQTVANVSQLLDRICSEQRLPYDSHLSKFLKMAPPIISKLRSGKTPMTASIIIRIHDATGLPIKEIRDSIAPRAEA